MQAWEKIGIFCREVSGSTRIWVQGSTMPSFGQLLTEALKIEVNPFRCAERKTGPDCEYHRPGLPVAIDAISYYTDYPLTPLFLRSPGSTAFVKTWITSLSARES